MNYIGSKQRVKAFIKASIKETVGEDYPKKFFAI